MSLGRDRALVPVHRKMQGDMACYFFAAPRSLMRSAVRQKRGPTAMDFSQIIAVRLRQDMARRRSPSRGARPVCDTSL